MKKIISLVLSLSLIFTLFSVSAFASFTEEICLYDENDVLPSDKEAEIVSSLQAMEINWGVPVKIALVSGQEGTELIFDAENFFNDNMSDGLLLYINTKNNDAALYANEHRKIIFNDYWLQDNEFMTESLLETKDLTSVLYGFIASAVSRLSTEMEYFEDFTSGSDYIPSQRLIPRIVDNANLLTQSEEDDLRNRLDETYKKHDLDVVIATVDYLDLRSAREFADDWYDYNGYGEGIILLLAMGERDWVLSGHGYGEYAFTYAGREMLMNNVLPDISDGYYYDGFKTFADMSEEFIQKAEAGEPFDEDNIPKEPMPAFYYMIALIIGLLAALFGSLALKSQLTSVKMQDRCDCYQKEGSLNIPERYELFLYRTVSRTAKPKETSSSGGSGGSYTSSSGRSHSSSSGKF